MFLGGKGNFIIKLFEFCEEYPETLGFLIALIGGTGLLGVVFGRYIERQKRQFIAEGDLFPMLKNEAQRLWLCLEENNRLTKDNESIFLLEYTKKLRNDCGLGTLFQQEEINKYLEIVDILKTHYGRGSVNITPRYANKKKWQASWDTLDGFFSFISNATLADTPDKVYEKTWSDDTGAPHIIKRKKLENAMTYILGALDLSEKNIIEWGIYEIKHFSEGLCKSE